MNAVSDIEVARGTPGAALVGGVERRAAAGDQQRLVRPGAAARPTFHGSRPAGGEWPGAVPGGGGSARHRSYSAVSPLVAAGVCLSRMICSTSAGVYPHATSWRR